MERIQTGETFTIESQNGPEQEVEVLGSLNIEGTEYVAVSFSEDVKNKQEEDLDVFFMKVDSDGDLTAIESDEEFTKVSYAFDEVMEE
ncbi:DUF1292 domain-containing protein [Peribacillus kribbensis]|uniref:DUF1292 domain-containing protein n=1 Tax=Peribacillus kribbensis TaxID=356658 RepID=UPI000426733C|nr:DUF1292 domain-containing protein [Peribacillus kribbensis]